MFSAIARILEEKLTKFVFVKLPGQSILEQVV
jgi:hypothetical protein